jgi:hypothetical protein
MNRISPSVETNICQQEAHWYRSSAVYLSYCANSVTASIKFGLPRTQHTRYDGRIAQVAEVCSIVRILVFWDVTLCCWARN